ncbi:MAG: CBS domain-containing protein [Aquificaceae bacterium]
MERIVFLEEGADLDALSSAYGILLLYPDSKLFKPKYLSRRASEVFKDFAHLFRTIEDLPEEFELVLTDTHRYQEYLEKYADRIKSIRIYDHHPIKKEGIKGKFEHVGSTTTLVVEELMEKGIDISSESATILCLGIYEDTGFLTYEGTTSRDVKVLAWLLEKGAKLNVARKYLSETLSKEQIDMLSKHLQSIESYFLNSKRVVILVIRSEEYQPEILRILYDLKEVRESSAFFAIVSAGQKTYVFGRSLRKEFDVSSVLERIGGGGHTFASATKLEGVDAQRVKSIVLSLIKGERVLLKVEDIMSYPVFVLHQDMKVEDAILELSQRNFAGAPTIDDSGRVVGIVYKKNLLRALKHYSERQVKDFMVGDFHALSPEDFVWKAEEILSHYGEKLIPVLKDEKLIGVVTRLDLLQGIKAQTYELKAYERRIKLPPHVEEISKEVGKIAKELGFRVYLVGGMVRDLLLSKKVWDLDFVVEGDAIKLSKRLAEKYGVSEHAFPEFGTAHIKIGDIKLEFATTRRETYTHPGAYPRVEYASLKEDLLRRDFTINAMAISVNEEDMGTLIDYFGGLRDLKDRIIRVLHPLSFVEDPVRILRALRFAGRLGFKLSKSTERLLKSAVSLDLLLSAPKGRLMNEFRLALREDRIIEILELYKKYHAIGQVIKDFQWHPSLEDGLLRLRSIVAWHKIEFPKEAIDYGWVYLIFLLKEMKTNQVLPFLQSMSAPSWVRKVCIEVVREFKSVQTALRKVQKSSDLYRALKGRPLPFLLLLMTVDDIKDKVKLYLEKLRFVSVDPKEFISLKGKELGRAIESKKLELMDKVFTF